MDPQDRRDPQEPPSSGAVFKLGFLVLEQSFVQDKALQGPPS